jgi:hypothetical protein
MLLHRNPALTLRVDQPGNNVIKPELSEAVPTQEDWNEDIEGHWNESVWGYWKENAGRALKRERSAISAREM